MQAQFQLGSDVVMCLDDCTSVEDSRRSRPSPSSAPSAGPACRQEFDKLLARALGRPGTPVPGHPCSLPVVQGGASERLRRGVRCPPGGDRLRRLRLRRLAPGPRGQPDHRPAGAGGQVGARRPAPARPRGSGARTTSSAPTPPSATPSSIAACRTRDARHRRLYAFLPDCDPAPGPAFRSRQGEPFYDVVYAYDQDNANDFGPIDPTCDCLLAQAVLARLPAPPVPRRGRHRRASGHAAQPALLRPLARRPQGEGTSRRASDDRRPAGPGPEDARALPGSAPLPRDAPGCPEWR